MVSVDNLGSIYARSTGSFPEQQLVTEHIENTGDSEKYVMEEWEMSNELINSKTLNNKYICDITFKVQEGRKWLFGVNFFSFKSAWIFACAFQLSGRAFPVFFWLVCTLFLRKTKTNYRSVHNERNKAEQERSTCKISGTFEGKKCYPKKSLTCTSLLHQAIQLHLSYLKASDLIFFLKIILLPAEEEMGKKLKEYTECKYGGPLGRRPGRVMKVRLARPRCFVLTMLPLKR